MAYDEQKVIQTMNAYSSSLSWIDSQEQTLLLRVKQWVAINSFSLNIKGLEQLLILLQLAFQSLGGERSYYSLNPYRILNSDGESFLQPLGRALCIRKRPEAPIQVL